jgi:hypothetical protein
VWGHITAGNQNDSTAHRFQSTQLRQHRPDLGEPLLGADRQFLAGETMALAAAHRCCFVTLVPQPVGLRQAVVEAPELKVLPLLWARPGRRHGEAEHDRGASVVRPDRWKTAAGEAQALPRRFRVVESTPLAKAKAPRRAAAQQTEGSTLAELPRQWQRRPFACEADAHQAASLCLWERHLHSQHRTSAARLRADKGQPAVEPRCKWAKNPAAIAAICLETPTRIAVRGCLYLIALLVYPLVARHVRTRLADLGETCPTAPRPVSALLPARCSTSCARLRWSLCSGPGSRIGR